MKKNEVLQAKLMKCNYHKLNEYFCVSKTFCDSVIERSERWQLS